MAGERKRLSRCVAALLLTSSLMTLAWWSAPSASAHRSDWCRHSDKYGQRWWVAYDYHYSYYYSGHRYHHHVTNHFYGPPGGFKKYKHNQDKLCSWGNYARAGVQAADPAMNAVNTATCAGTGVEVNQHAGCAPVVHQDDVPVEELPPVNDPKLPGSTLQPLIDYVNYCRTQYHPLLNPQACDPPIGAVRWARLERRAGGTLVERPVGVDDAAPCVTSITDTQGHAFALAAGNRVAVVETAPRALAAQLGHPC